MIPNSHVVSANQKSPTCHGFPERTLPYFAAKISDQNSQHESVAAQQS